MKCVLVISLSLANCFLVTSYTLVSSGQSGEKHNAVRADASRQATAKLTPSQVFSIANPSVVMIVASSQNDKEQALGSGFIVNQNRVVTNHHVVEGMSQAYVLFSDGKVQPVSEVISDSVEQDLIVLGVETGQRRQLLFGDELSLREGDAVYAIGAPKGLELSFTNGIVSSFRKSGSQFLIQTTAPIAPGSSGGPLLDGSGQVVGVTTARITDAPGIYFSVGIGDVKRLLRTPFGATLGLKEWADQQKTESGVSVPSHSEKGEDGKPSLEATFGWMTDFSMRHGKYTNKEEQHSNYLQQERGCEAKITHSVT